MQNDYAVIIKKERDSGSKKTKIETITQPKDVNDLGSKNYQFLLQLQKWIWRI